MRWVRQVVHVAGKDVRGNLWMILATLAALAMTAFAAWGGTPDGTRGGDAETLVVGLVGGGPLFYVTVFALLALLVQADRPGDGDEFWVTRPLSPSAVLGAKLIVIGVVLWLLPSGVHYGVLLKYPISPGEALRLAGWSSAAFAGLLAAALAVAVLTRDLRSYLIALVVGLVGWSVLLTLFRGASAVEFGSSATGLFHAFSWIGVGLLTAGLQYRWRRRGLTLAVAVPLLMVGAWWPPSMPPGALAAGPDGVGDPPAELRATDLRVSVEGAQPGRVTLEGVGRRLSVMFALHDAASGHRYLLVPSVTVELPDGSSHDVTRAPFPVLLAPGEGVAGRRTVEGIDEVRRVGVSLDLPGSLAESIRSGGGTLRVEGWIQVAEARRHAPVPARVGASWEGDGWRYSVTTVAGTRDAPALEVVATHLSLAATGRNPWSSPTVDDLEMTLADASGEHGIRLDSRRDGERGEGAGLLPGVFARTQRLVFSAQPRDGGNPQGAVSAERGYLVLRQWVPVGRYRVVTRPVALGIQD